MGEQHGDALAFLPSHLSMSSIPLASTLLMLTLPRCSRNHVVIETALALMEQTVSSNPLLHSFWDFRGGVTWGVSLAETKVELRPSFSQDQASDSNAAKLCDLSTQLPKQKTVRFDMFKLFLSLKHPHPVSLLLCFPYISLDSSSPSSLPPSYLTLSHLVSGLSASSPNSPHPSVLPTVPQCY